MKHGWEVDMKILHMAACVGLLFVTQNRALFPDPPADQSLFTPRVVESKLVKDAFAFIEKNKDATVAEWIALTEIPAPSGKEEKRAAVLRDKFAAAGLDKVGIDAAGNVVGVWPGSGRGKRVAVSAHMDTVFQGVTSIKVVREGGCLRAPGIGDDTASLINLLVTLRALKAAGFRPENTYYFLATVGEETSFKGIREFLKSLPEPIDMVLALDDDLGKVHYGALGFGGGRIVFRGPGAHTMQSKGVANPNLAVAKAIQRICEISVPDSPPEWWTVINVGMIGGGKVRNAVSQESFLAVDLRSANQEELLKARAAIREACEAVARETGTTVSFELNEAEKASQLPGAADSSLVKTLVDILRYLAVPGIEVDPCGSTEANAGIELGIPSVNIGRTYGVQKHSLEEEADIEGLFTAQKQLVLLLASLR
jgi:acetylornithine deacetylase/succinyl-diaminopimelate desuccinylase-like protein